MNSHSSFERLDVKTLWCQTSRMKNPTPTKRATVYLDGDLHRALRLKAAEIEKPISVLINDAVRLSLREDAEDLSAFEERAKEKSMPFAQVLKRLRSRGKL